MIEITSKFGGFSIYANDLIEAYHKIESFNLLENIVDDDEIIFNEK